jgi:hypothetical protein
MKTNAALKVDKSAFAVGSLTDEGDEKAFWHGKNVYERLQAIELIRQVIYGYDPASSRLQRFFEVAELQGS